MNLQLLFKALEHISPRAVAEFFHLDIRRDRMACPFHNGQARNLSIRPDKPYCHCFVCNHSWGALSLYQQLSGIEDRVQAAKAMARDFGIEVPEDTMEARRAYVQERRHRENRQREIEQGRKYLDSSLSEQLTIERTSQALLIRYPLDPENEAHVEKAFQIVFRMANAHDKIENLLLIDRNDEDALIALARKEEISHERYST